MSKFTKKDLVNYWVKTAKHDYKTMMALFNSKRYSDCLFYGHIVLEKILKALVVQQTEKQSPYSHNLLRLSQYAKLEECLQSAEIELLGKVNDFNIRARYPDYKFRFYKKATLPYTVKYLSLIKNLYKKLCLMIKK